MEAFQQQGFSVLNDFYTKNEIKELINVLSVETDDRPTFRRSKELFAIRQVLKEFPSLGALIFNSKLKQLISENFGDHYFVSKSIYFDKPGNSNWFVAYHQDPLLFHASGKSTGTRSRRVLHIELSNHELPEALNWSERFEYH